MAASCFALVSGVTTYSAHCPKKYLSHMVVSAEMPLPLMRRLRHVPTDMRGTIIGRISLRQLKPQADH
jgi:hypothetical protein